MDAYECYNNKVIWSLSQDIISRDLGDKEFKWAFRKLRENTSTHTLDFRNSLEIASRGLLEHEQ